MTKQQTLQRTPLYEEHLALNARMVPFGGWEMPVQYDGILTEHQSTREGVSIFDISHMGEFIIEGDLGETGLDEIVTMNLQDLPVHACRYGCMLNDKGGVIDDLIVFRIEKDKWFLVVNGATTQKDAAHFRAKLRVPNAFKDVSLETGKIDVQGPLSLEILSSFVANIKKLDYYTFDYFDLLDEHVLISRTGYTGELGYEIYFPWSKTADLWKALLEDTRVKPAGLGARDVLRLEMGYSLYGHELNEETSPLESGLNRFIDFDKEFAGKDVLLKQRAAGLKRKLVGVSSNSRRSPREGHKIYSQDGDEIGEITSGTFSPCLNRGIGLGFVAADKAVAGTNVAFGDDKSKVPAVFTGRSFYKGGSVNAANK